MRPSASGRLTDRLKRALRALAAVLFVASGINHFARAEGYRRVVPPAFPAPRALVAFSGVCEIAGGLGLLIRPLRRAAGWGLIALLVAVFPANVYMATSSDQIPGTHLSPPWLWLRLPLQGVFVAWVWYVALGPKRREFPIMSTHTSAGPTQ
jgi:uncharacterized membrane protein